MIRAMKLSEYELVAQRAIYLIGAAMLAVKTGADPSGHWQDVETIAKKMLEVKETVDD